MFNLILNIWFHTHLFLCVIHVHWNFKRNSWNAYLQRREAFADKPGYEGVQLLGLRYVNYSNGFRWLPVALTSNYLNLEIYYFLFCYLFPISCHSNPQLMSFPRCGSIIVDLALKFNSTTMEQNVIITLNDYVKDGKLGEFSVGAIK